MHLINRGFLALRNPRPVLVALVASDGTVHTLRADAGPRTWQPYRPDDPDFEPVVHTIALDSSTSADLTPGNYRIGLWLPDAAESLRLNPLYAVRVANDDTVWWRDGQNRYGINVFGIVAVE